MDKYFKIQKLVELQKERKQKLEGVFIDLLKFLPKMEIDFQAEERLSYKNLGKEVVFKIKIKIKDKSSVKFVVMQNKEKIIEYYSKIFPEDFLQIF